MADTSSPAEGGFDFPDRLVGVWGGSDDYRAEVERLTGSAAVRMLPVEGGPATVLAPAPQSGDLSDLQQQLRSAVTDADEAAVYGHTASNVVSGSGALAEASYLMVVRLYADDKWRNSFRDWLHEEHLTRQPTTGGVVWAHLYETVDDDRWHFLNLWGGDDDRIFDSAEWAEIRDTDRFFTVSGVFSECRSVRQIFRIG